MTFGWSSIPAWPLAPHCLAAFVREAELTVVDSVVSACRDPNDNKFLELAISGKASHIITGDSDLLVLHPFRGIELVTPQAFLDAIPQR